MEECAWSSPLADPVAVRLRILMEWLCLGLAAGRPSDGGAASVDVGGVPELAAGRPSGSRAENAHGVVVPGLGPKMIFFGRKIKVPESFQDQSWSGPEYSGSFPDCP